MGTAPRLHPTPASRQEIPSSQAVDVHQKKAIIPSWQDLYISDYLSPDSLPYLPRIPSFLIACLCREICAQQPWRPTAPDPNILTRPDWRSR